MMLPKRDGSEVRARSDSFPRATECWIDARLRFLLLRSWFQRSPRLGTELRLSRVFNGRCIRSYGREGMKDYAALSPGSGFLLFLLGRDT